MDFKLLPYMRQRDFVDPYLREDKKAYHPLINEPGHPWDTCMISSRAMPASICRSFTVMDSAAACLRALLTASSMI